MHLQAIQMLLIYLYLMKYNLNYLYLYYTAHFFYGIAYYIMGPYVLYLSASSHLPEHHFFPLIVARALGYLLGPIFKMTIFKNWNNLHRGLFVNLFIIGITAIIITLTYNVIILSIAVYFMAVSIAILDIYIHISIMVVTQNVVGRTIIFSNGIMVVGACFGLFMLSFLAELSSRISGILTIIVSFSFFLVKNIKMDEKKQQDLQNQQSKNQEGKNEEPTKDQLSNEDEKGDKKEEVQEQIKEQIKIQDQNKQPQKPNNQIQPVDEIMPPQSQENIPVDENVEASEKQLKQISPQSSRLISAAIFMFASIQHSYQTWYPAFMVLAGYMNKEDATFNISLMTLLLTYTVFVKLNAINFVRFSSYANMFLFSAGVAAYFTDFRVYLIYIGPVIFALANSILYSFYYSLPSRYGLKVTVEHGSTFIMSYSMGQVILVSMVGYLMVYVHPVVLYIMMTFLAIVNRLLVSLIFRQLERESRDEEKEIEMKG